MVGFTGKEVLGQRPEGGVGRRQVSIWEKSLPDRGIHKYKGPGAGLCLVCLRSSKEAGVPGAEGVRSRGDDNTGRG